MIGGTASQRNSLQSTPNCSVCVLPRWSGHGHLADHSSTPLLFTFSLLFSSFKINLFFHNGHISAFPNNTFFATSQVIFTDTSVPPLQSLHGDRASICIIYFNHYVLQRPALFNMHHPTPLYSRSLMMLPKRTATFAPCQRHETELHQLLWQASCPALISTS